MHAIYYDSFRTCPRALPRSQNFIGDEYEDDDEVVLYNPLCNFTKMTLDS